MDQDLTREQNMRKKYIELFVDKLYTRFNYLFTDKIEVVKQKALDKYLNSNMTIPEITEDMVKIIEKMKEEYNKNNKKDEPKEVDNIPTTHEEMPVTNQEEIEDVEVVHVPVTAPSVEPDWQMDNIPTTAVDTHFSDLLRKDDDYSDSTITKIEDKKAPNKTPDGSIAVDELNGMLNDKPKEEKIENKNALEKPKQYVKTNNNADSNSKGFVSLFSIGISILAVTAVVLIAMILNLLLK